MTTQIEYRYDAHVRRPEGEDTFLSSITAKVSMQFGRKVLFVSIPDPGASAIVTMKVFFLENRANLYRNWVRDGSGKLWIQIPLPSFNGMDWEETVQRILKGMLGILLGIDESFVTVDCIKRAADEY